MLFLVVSTPRPERPTELVGVRQSFWPWIAKYEAAGLCKQVYARVGRGAIAVFDVDGNTTLHRILNEWADIVPAHFDTYPLIDAASTKAFLSGQAKSPAAKSPAATAPAAAAPASQALGAKTIT